MKFGKYAKGIVIGGVVVLPMVFVVLNCSGMLFPLWGVQGKLERGFKDDFGVAMPGGAKGIKGAYHAYMDRSEFFWVEMAPADVVAWMTTLETASKARGYFVNDEKEDPRLSLFERGPEWYEPQKLPDVRALKVGIPGGKRGGSTGYWVFYSAASGKVFIYWYET